MIYFFCNSDLFISGKCSIPQISENKGEKNQRFFILSVFSSFILFLFSLNRRSSKCLNNNLI